MNWILFHTKFPMGSCAADHMVCFFSNNKEGMVKKNLKKNGCNAKKKYSSVAGNWLRAKHSTALSSAGAQSPVNEPSCTLYNLTAQKADYLHSVSSLSPVLSTSCSTVAVCCFT